MNNINNYDKSVEIFIPGRFCVIGEHSDWASGYRRSNPNIEKGYAIVIGLKEGIYLQAEISDSFSYEYQGDKLELTEGQLQDETYDGFYEYVISSARLMKKRYNVFGIKIRCTKVTMPVKKGLSSSAAICMGIIRSYNLIYNLNISVDSEMELAYEAETSTGSKCGRLDQICAYGTGIRMMTFDGDDITIDNISYKGKWVFLVVDLNGKKDTKKILSDLNSRYPIPNTKKEEKLIDFFGSYNKNAVKESRKCIESGDVKRLGEIMIEYQDEFDENVAPFSSELKAPLLHQFFDNIRDVEGVLGFKGVGSQGDGMAQVLVDYDVKDSVKNYIETKLLLDCIMVEM